MDFRQAEQFLAVIDHGGVGRAAESLGLSQPTVSQTIKALEREAGAPLFHRVGHGLTPTAEGRALIRPVRRLLRDVGAARASVAGVAGILSGRLELAVIGASLERLVPVLGEFRRRHPQVSARVVCPDVERTVVRAVQDRRCELGFLPMPAVGDAADAFDADPGGVVAERWGTDEMVLILPPGVHHDLPDPLELDRLPDYPIVAVPDGAYARSAVEAVLRRARVRVRAGVITGHRDMLVPLVLAGVGMAFTLAEYGRDAQRQGAQLRRLTPAIGLDYGLVRSSGPLSPAARAFVELARTRLAAGDDRQDA